MATWAINIKPGIFWVSRWFPGLDPLNHKITNSQVWIRLHELPLEFRKKQNVQNVATGVGLPLKIDPLSHYHGTYARVLVDVDFTQPLPKRILAKMIDEKSNLDVIFFVPISYEKLPRFSESYLMFNHGMEGCKKSKNFQNKAEEKENRQENSGEACTWEYLTS